jgi:hypothetical protein
MKFGEYFMPKNVVLRFRDLVGEIGDTIDEHRKLIRKFSYVWWGWWHIPGEKIPREVFSDFQARIKKVGHICIFLADKGTYRLYKAKLIGINLSSDENALECSEIDKVPEYYAFKKCLIWFCFSEMTDISSSEIRAWVYDEPPDFLFKTEPDKFNGKRITSIQEMLDSRHQTMYFIKPYKHNSMNNSFLELENYTHEILKLIESINKYCHYSTRAAKSPVNIPLFQKEIEERLKCPAEEEGSFREFSSSLYSLIIDGHEPVLRNDSAIMTKDQFYKFAYHFLRNIRVFRCDHHHLKISDNEKMKLGRLYKEICGKNVLDDSDSRIKFQLEMLKRTVNFLRKELDIVKIMVDQLAA